MTCEVFAVAAKALPACRGVHADHLDAGCLAVSLCLESPA